MRLLFIVLAACLAAASGTKFHSLLKKLVFKKHHHGILQVLPHILALKKHAASSLKATLADKLWKFSHIPALIASYKYKTPAIVHHEVPIYIVPQPYYVPVHAVPVAPLSHPIYGAQPAIDILNKIFGFGIIGSDIKNLNIGESDSAKAEPSAPTKPDSEVGDHSDKELAFGLPDSERPRKDFLLNVNADNAASFHGEYNHGSTVDTYGPPN